MEFHYKSIAVTVRQISPMIRAHQKFESKGLAIEGTANLYSFRFIVNLYSLLCQSGGYLARQ